MRSTMWTKFIGERNHGNICHQLVMKESSISNAQKSTSSQILCCALERSTNIRNPTKLGRKGLNGSSLRKATETMTESMESRLNSSGTSSQDSQRCSSAVKSQIYWATWEKHQKLSQEEFSLCQCSTTFPVTEKAIKKNVWQMPKSYLCMQGNSVLDSGHLLVQVLKRSGILWKRIAHKEFGIISRIRCWWNSPKADVQFSVQQLHCPGEISKAEDMENCRYILLRTIQQLRQAIFRIIVFAISSVFTEQ